jgi:hypothetical protein
VPLTPRSLTEPAAKLAIVAPVFNDWSCVGPLIAGLEATSGLPADTTLFLVDDGSTEAMPTEIPTGIIPVEVIRLGANIGHQRAIAVGLVRIAKTKFADAVIVIDADGEDLPADCRSLWQTHVANQSAVIVAQRLKRNESARFKLFYALYRFFFRILTGRRLDFGNFSLRFAGRSRMNFISLVNHGLAGIAAFVDTAYARLLAWSIVAMGILGVATIGGVIYRLTNVNPLPGWVALGATTAVVALFQIIAGLIVVSFLTLSLRAQPNLPPLEVAGAYISEEFSVTRDSFGDESSLVE